MLLPVIYLSKHWKAIECWKNQHFQLKKYSLLLRECFSALYSIENPDHFFYTVKAGFSKNSF